LDTAAALADIAAEMRAEAADHRADARAAAADANAPTRVYAADARVVRPGIDDSDERKAAEERAAIDDMAAPTRLAVAVAERPIADIDACDRAEADRIDDDIDAAVDVVVAAAARMALMYGVAVPVRRTRTVRTATAYPRFMTDTCRPRVCPPDS
jgi:hypothetical protein